MGVWIVLGANAIFISLQVCLWEQRYFYNLFVVLTSGREGESKHVLCIYLVFPRDNVGSSSSTRALGMRLEGFWRRPGQGFRAMSQRDTQKRKQGCCTNLILKKELTQLLFDYMSSG